MNSKVKKNNEHQEVPAEKLEALIAAATDDIITGEHLEFKCKEEIMSLEENIKIIRKEIPLINEYRWKVFEEYEKKKNVFDDNDFIDWLYDKGVEPSETNNQWASGDGPIGSIEVKEMFFDYILEKLKSERGHNDK